MPHRGEMPRVEGYWIALGIVVVAAAVAFGPRRRKTFLDALRELTALHERRERVIVFGNNHRSSRTISNAIRQGVTWLRRLLDEVESGPTAK